MTNKIKKVVLAYSGGLDTSIILKWLQSTYDCEVVTFTADLGQGDEIEPARKKAEMLGVKEIYIEDLREDFVSNYIFPMFRANTLYEGQYLLGTAIARPLIAKRQIEIANETGADAVCHGATGKGNDQVRFELGYYALKPNIKVISPWRDWDLKSRTKLIEFAEENQIPIPKDKKGEAPFSIDANILHTSSEGKLIENPENEPPEYIYQRTLSIDDSNDIPTEITIGFEKGDPISINGNSMTPVKLFEKLRDAYGPEPHFLHDVHHRLTPLEAAQLGKMLEPYRMFWLEDTVPAENQEGFRLIRQHTTTPLAVGEVFNTIWDCKTLLQEQLVDYIRTTVVHAGGITHLRRIADLAGLHHIRTGSHGATDLSPVCMGAALHFDTWVPNFGIQEYMRHTEETDAVFPHDYRFEDGFLYCGESSGHGVDIDETLAEKYPYQRAFLPVNRLEDGTMWNW